MPVDYPLRFQPLFQALFVGRAAPGPCWAKTCRRATGRGELGDRRSRPGPERCHRRPASRAAAAVAGAAAWSRAVGTPPSPGPVPAAVQVPRCPADICRCRCIPTTVRLHDLPARPWQDRGLGRLARGTAQPDLCRVSARVSIDARWSGVLTAGNAEQCLHWFEPHGRRLRLHSGGDRARAGSRTGRGRGPAVEQHDLSPVRLESCGAGRTPRELHIQVALDVIDFAAGPVAPSTPQPTLSPHADRLVACDKFVLDRWSFSQPHELGGDDRCHLVSLLPGSLAISGDAGSHPLVAGQTVLIPAAAGSVRVTPLEPTTLLDVFLPG